MTRATVFLCAALLGAALMGFEMVASRWLTPYFGSEIMTWAALISAVLLSLTVGYFAGGWLVDRFPSFLLPAGFAAFAGVWLLLVPANAQGVLDSIMNWSIDIDSNVNGVLVASAALLILPITALGTFSPIALRLLIKNVATTGRTAGLVYGISTAGNIVGTLGTVLYLIPNVGRSTITYVLGGTCLVCAVMLFALATATRRRLVPAEAR